MHSSADFIRKSNDLQQRNMSDLQTEQSAQQIILETVEDSKANDQGLAQQNLYFTQGSSAGMEFDNSSK